MQVKIVSNQRRSGVGKRPARENRRAWLPQQARFCPVLEDASKSGFLIYPPLHPHESYQVRLTETSALRLTFYVGDEKSGMRAPAFAVDMTPSSGTGGIDHTEIAFIEERSGLDAATVQQMFDALVTNLNGPPGGIGLRGAHDFITPEGWDTIYTGILNEPQQPAVPVLTARIETDWYAQPTEFRYVLQRGDTVSASGDAPIGQVLFVPREDVTLADASPSEQAQFEESQRTYWAERHAKERTTNFGATYSYHYRDVQKAQRGDGGPAILEDDEPPTDPDA